MTSRFGARLSRDGTRHLFTNQAWNSHLSPGATTSFEWVASGSGEPQGCVVNGAPCGGGLGGAG